MEFFDVIENRYSVRGYKKDKVEKEKLDKILKAATIAPTGVNSQGFKVFVIGTEKNKEALKKIYAQNWFVEAPLVLCVVADKSKIWTRPWDAKNIADIDATIVMDHIILAATDLGLGTCYIAAFKKYEAIKFLNLSEEYEPILFTPLGYPSADRADRPRKPVNEIVEYI
ncbi:MAG: nitroreductase family protein [Methanobrevibacter sp.]|jgi:nitroreductase|nr:nitroreductase family protein [Candidatus Methanovirga australis]